MSYRSIYDALIRHYGPQHWWPGDSLFEIMVGAVLTQNTAWTNVERAIANLKTHNVLDPRAILAARPHSLAKWLQPSGYFNVKAKRLRHFCHWYVACGGFEALRQWSTPELRHALLSVHGVGPETADDILLYAFDRPVFVIDAYTRRLFYRLGMVDEKAGYEALRSGFERHLPHDVPLFNEYHALIVRHAKEICTKRKPRCGQCCIASLCLRRGVSE